MYHGPLVPSIYRIGTAHGNSDCEDMMGTVILWLTDDEGVEHTLTLESVVYLEGSRVNIMSTQLLSELYPNGNGQPDKRGTRVTSVFKEHTLFWNQKNARVHFIL